jgi:hypothetical protein
VVEMLFDNLVKVFCIAPAFIYSLGIAGSGMQTLLGLAPPVDYFNQGAVDPLSGAMAFLGFYCFLANTFFLMLCIRRRVILRELPIFIFLQMVNLTGHFNISANRSPFSQGQDLPGAILQLSAGAIYIAYIFFVHLLPLFRGKKASRAKSRR